LSVKDRNNDFMAKTTAPLQPESYDLLRQFAERLRLARLRRKLTAKQVAEQAGMVPLTLRNLEQGGAGVTIGAYVAVMQVLGISDDLQLLAQADPVGREIQDSQLKAKLKPLKRNAKSKTPPPTRRGRVTVTGAQKLPAPVLASLVSSPAELTAAPDSPAPKQAANKKTPANAKTGKVKVDQANVGKEQNQAPARKSQLSQWDWIADSDSQSSES
jgi:transcriptional regulator with XRE-family HTH domain